MNLPTSDLITIVGYYLDEWKHRDNMYQKYTFTFFYATLIVFVFQVLKL